MQCFRTRSLDVFFASVAQATPSVLGLLGCGCSVASESVAEVVHHWNISQVSDDSNCIVYYNAIGLTSNLLESCSGCIGASW